VPTYAYACTACEHRFEVQQAFSDAAITECPECAGRLRKLFNSVGIVFKGSGFYRTDSRAKDGAGASKDGSAEKTPAAAESSSPGTSSSAGSSKPADGGTPAPVATPSSPSAASSAA
jgi:putative FmdB family regulatory protein